MRETAETGILQKCGQVHLILDRFGENDGVVTVESAHNPKGEHLGTLHFNHAQMGDGEFIWRYLEPAIEGRPELEAVPASTVPYCTPPAQILRGGRLEKGVNESFHIDGTVEDLSVSITIAGNIAPKYFILISPSGAKSPLSAKRTANGVIQLRTSLHAPEKGRWKLKAAQGNGAYCAIISMHGSKVCCSCPDNAVPDHIGVDLRILRTYVDGYDVVGEYSYKDGMFLPQPPRLENGVYNIEMNLSGLLDDGSTFERTLIRPLAEGNNLQELLKQTAKKTYRKHK